MKVIETDIDDCLILEPQVFGDSRGYFFEGFHQENFKKETGIDFKIKQYNVSKSVYGVIRGLHYQLAPHAQAKLVGVTNGRVMDFVMDLRTGSPTFKKIVRVELDGESKRMVYVPKGCAHGIIVFSETMQFYYFCDEFYAPKFERGINFADPELAIPIDIPENKRIFSEKDQNLPKFKESTHNFVLNN